MSSAGGPDEAGNASGDMTRSYLKSSRQNMQEITKQVGHNLELQSIILNTIKDFKKQKQDRDVSFASLVDNTLQSRKKKK